jgi:HAD superfamily hydrolase (TIGR01509 family)
MSGKVFISYRRDDSSGYAHAVYNKLCEHLGQSQIIFDVDTIEPGIDFIEFIEKALGTCDVLIALIGRSWLTVSDTRGRKIDNPNDLVRLEIATALRRNIRLIPALLEGAHMPRADELPEDIQSLMRRNAIEISNSRFNTDMNILIRALSDILNIPERRDAAVESDTAHVESVPNERLALLHGESVDRHDFKVIDKFKASEIFHKRLSDPKVYNVKVISYTNEVEAGAINRYSVQGPKRIEIYKRSIISDLAEQQAVNTDRLLVGSSLKPWDKKSKSVPASVLIEKEFKDSEGIEVLQYFYEGAPTKRAYVFDDKEAVVTFYETYENVTSVSGSIYKGMAGSPFIWITNDTDYGKFLLAELDNFAKSVRLTGRTWETEKELLSSGELRACLTKSPCIEPKAVFLDLDGVIYNSLPLYVEAWSQAFREIGVTITQEDVYLQEGRSGQLTVDVLLKKYNKAATQVEMKHVQEFKGSVLNTLGKPPIMDGARELLSAIESSGLPYYIVTGSSKDSLLDDLREDFGERFSEKNLVTGKDVKYGKPSPEPYIIACAKANVFPSAAIVVENAPLGIESAVRCGTYCIAVNTGILHDAILKRCGARNIVKDCRQLSQLWESFIGILNI